MTLVLALRGTDGWVLAADRRATRSQLVNGDISQVATIHTHVQKIYHYPAVGLVYAIAGDHIANLVGEAIVERLKAPSSSVGRATLLTEVALACWLKYVQGSALGLSLNVNSRSLVVVFTQPPFEIWSLHIRPVPEAVEQHDFDVLGDLHNGSKLFPKLYYSNRTVESLKLFAAHTILMGHAFAESAVDGLDVWTGDNSGKVAQLAPSELGKLRLRSRTIDEIIASAFGIALSDVQR
jgi:hypothetical protein